MIPNPMIIDTGNGKESKWLTVYDASVTLSIDTSSSASIRIAEGEQVNGRVYVKMFTQQGSAGIFRTRSPKTGVGGMNSTIELEHSVNALGDYIFAESVEEELTISDAAKKVFGYYKGGLWKLGAIDNATTKIVLDSDHESCLEALSGIMDQLPSMMFTYDFTTFPWTLNIKSRPTTVTAEGRISRNVKGATITVDDTDLCTRVFIEGLEKDGEYGYLEDADAIKEYGTIETVVSGSNSTTEIAKKTAQTYLNKHKKPQYTIEIDGIELSSLTGEDFDKIEIGKLMRLALPDYGITVEETVTQIVWSSVYQNPLSVSVTLSEEADNVIKYISSQTKAISKASSKASSASKTASSAIVRGEVRDNTLYLYNAKDEQVVSFKKAARVTVAWSGNPDGRFTVKPSYNDNEGYTEVAYLVGSMAKENKDGSAYTSGNAWYIPIRVVPQIPNAADIKTGYRVYVDAQPKWNEGWDNAEGMMVFPSKVPSGEERTTFSISYPRKGTSITGKVTREQTTREFEITKGIPPASGSTSIGFAAVSALGETVGRIDISDWYDTGYANGYRDASEAHSDDYDEGWLAARNSVTGKTYEYNSKTYNYNPSTGVALADRLDWIYVARPSATVNGGIDDTNRQRYVVTVAKEYAYIRYGTANGQIVAQKAHTVYSDGWTAAKASVQNKSYTYDGKTYSYNPTTSVAAADRLDFIYVARPSDTVDGSIDDTNRLKYTITSANNIAYLRYGGANGYVVAQIEHNKYTAGYNDGWDKARKSVTDKTYTYDGKTYSYFPTASVSLDDRLNWIYVAKPSTNVDGGIDDNNRQRYYVTVSQNYAYIRFGSANGNVVAQAPHNYYTTGYNAGWGAARSSVQGKTYTYGGKTYDYNPTTSVAVADRLDWIYIARPSNTVDGGIDDNNRLKYTITSADDIAYLRYGGANGYVVAQVTHNKWTNGRKSGWEAARKSVTDKTYTYNSKTYAYFPTASVTAADRLDWFYVARPSTTVDGGIDDNNRLKYVVTVSQGYAYIRYGSANGNVIAQVPHTQYTDGYNTGWGNARLSVTNKTYTYNSKTYSYFPTESVAAADRLDWIYVAKPNETVDGGINDTNRQRYYVTSGNDAAYIRYGSASGNVVAQVTHNKYTTGYNAGWGAARASVTDKTYTYGGKTYDYNPTTSVSSSDRLDWIYIAKPSATVDGGIDDNNRLKYTVTTTKTKAYIRYGGANGNVVAWVDHDWYSQGWDAARASVTGKTYTYNSKTYDYNPTSSVASADRLDWIYVAKPNTTVDGAIDDNNRLKYCVTTTKTKAYIRYGSSNGNVVAWADHDWYDQGWTAAKDSVLNKTYAYNGKTYYYNPTASVASADRLDWIYIARPSDTVDGGINDYNRLKYTVTVSQNYAFLRYGGTSGHVVAAVSHTQYTDGYNSGWGAARSSVTNKTYTYNSKTYDYNPTSSVASADRLNWIYIAKPSSTVDGGIDDNNRLRYYVTVSQNYAYIRYGTEGGNVVAWVPHSQYTDGYSSGWGAARSSVNNKTYTYGGKTYAYFPTESVTSADRLNWIYVAKPSTNVDGGIDDNNRMRYYVTSGDNTAYIRYGSSSGSIVAKVDHNKYSTGYNTGWGNARSAVRGKSYTYDSKTYYYFPTESVAAENRLNWIYVAQPSSTVDGGIDDSNRQKYYVTAGNNKAYIRYGSENGNIVAETSYTDPYTARTFVKAFNTDDSVYHGKLYNSRGEALTDDSYYWFGYSSNLGGSSARITLYTHN